jgi:hypothetical protein
MTNIEVDAEDEMELPPKLPFKRSRDVGFLSWTRATFGILYWRIP